MTTRSCPQHKCELVHRSGTSKKTGKPYDFYACPQKQGDNYCPYTENENGPSRKALESQTLTNLTVRMDKMAEFLKSMDENIKEILRNLPQN